MYDWAHLASYDDPELAIAHYESLERSPGEKAIFDDNGEGQPLHPDDVRDRVA